MRGTVKDRLPQSLAESIGQSQRAADHAATTTTCRVPKTPQEWENMRAIVTKLYLEDGLQLKDVQEIMETRYKFRATYVEPNCLPENR